MMASFKQNSFAAAPRNSHPPAGAEWALSGRNFILTVTRRVAEFARNVSYHDLPEDAVAKAKLLMLDTLGVAIGSTTLDFGKSTLELADEWQAVSGGSVIGSGTLVQPHHAALINGILAHGQDFDDTHTESVVHPSGALVPAMLACAERDGSSGRDALLALVLGTEISLRLALPARNAFHLRGFHTTSVACTFGVALLSALLGQRRDEAQLTHAMGIAGSFASGLLECVPAASSAKRLHAGWAGLCGIMADDLSRSGFTGPPTVIEGRLGVYNSMLRGQDFDLEEIFQDLGEHWHLFDIRPKLYPCCHYLQAFIDCAGRLRSRPGFDVTQIRQINARVAQGSVNMICEPWTTKIAPQTGYDARFSLAYAISTMLLRGRAGQAEFMEDKLGDPDTLALMQKVQYKVDPAFEVKDMPAWIEIDFNDGSTHIEELASVRGNARNPISENEILGKFRDCTRAFDPTAIEAISDQVLSLECADSLAGLTQGLAKLRPVSAS